MSPTCVTYVIISLVTVVKLVSTQYSDMKGEANMIKYDPFWKTLKNSPQTTYTLINNYHISSATIDKLRNNKPLNTTTINDLCKILNCRIEDIAEYVPSEDDQKLY